jgi:anti-sigma factor RsiW
MTQPDGSACDGVLLDRYLDGDLGAEEKTQMRRILTVARIADDRRQL